MGRVLRIKFTLAIWNQFLQKDLECQRLQRLSLALSQMPWLG